MSCVHRERTSRGFALLLLEDADGNRFSLQESSLATEARVWIGPYGSDRAHMNQKQAKKLMKELEVFVKTGHLRCPGGLA